MVITIFTFFAISVNDIDKYIGCTSEFEGIISSYNTIDNYLVGADTLFCSDYCPCNLFNKNEYLSDTEAYPNFKTWNITSDSNSPVNYQGCPDSVHTFLYKSYSERYKNTTFNEIVFWNYYSYIESTFDCVGFCRTKYYSDISHQNVTMYKYVYSNVNR